LAAAWLAFAPGSGLAARDYVAEAAKALQNGDLKAAQIQLRNAVRDDPQNAEAHFQLARVNLFLADPVAAQREAEAARDRGYEPRKVMPLLAQAYLMQGKNRELLKDFAVTNKDPALDAQILVARGYAQAALHDVDGAATSFKTAESLAPDALEPLTAQFRLAMATGDLATAQSKVDRSIALQPRSQEALLEKAQLLHRKGDLTGALAAAEELVKVAPSFPDGRIERATLLIATGKLDQAKQDLAAALAAVPNNPRALLLQALLQARQKDYAGADNTLQRIAAVMPSLPRAYFLQAFVKAQIGQWEQAEDAAQRFVAKVPNDLAGLKMLAGIEMQRQRPDKVIDVLAKPAAAGLADAATYDLLGRAYAISGQQDAATQAFEKAAALAPADARVRERLAASRYAEGDPAAAANDLEKALDLAPNQPAVGAALFFAELATGDLNRAAAAVDRVRQAQGDTPVVENLEGLLKLARLDLAGARAQFSKLAETAPDFTPAKVNLARLAAMDGHADDAMAILKGILDKAPASEPALGLYVSSQSAMGRTADAIAALERARAEAPNDVRLTVMLADLLTRTGDGAKALELLTADKTRLAASPVLLAAQVRAQLALKQTEEARGTLMRILAIEPRALDARQALIDLSVQAAQYEAARNLVQEGLRVSPENFQLLGDYIAIANKEGGLDRALATADRLRGQIGDTPQARAIKGDVYAGAHQFDAAVNEYAAQLKQAPSTYLALRLAGAQMAAGKVDDARQTLKDWQAKNPKDLAATETLAGIELGQGRDDAAEALLKTVLAAKPRDGVALNNLAWIYQKRGDGQARDLAQQAYLLMPGGQTADTLGWILVKQGDAATGLPLLRQAASQLGNNLDVQYHLAAALNDTGRRDEARKLLTAMLETKANFEEKSAAEKLLDTLSKS
jgi:putative PEP-CTERM system TPR-repeat lipoprotein